MVHNNRILDIIRIQMKKRVLNGGLAKRLSFGGVFNVISDMYHAFSSLRVSHLH